MVSGSVFLGLPGVIRILTIVVGMIDLGFAIDGYLHHYRNEEFLLGVVIVCLILSTILAMSLCWVDSSERINKIDIIYHIIGATLLLIGGILWLYSVFRFGRSYSKWYFGERILAGILGLVNSGFYGLLAWLRMRKS